MELLIVMVILSSLLALSGSFSVDYVDKTRAQVEVISAYGLIKESGMLAFTSGKEVVMKFSGADLKIMIGEDVRKRVNFEYLQFDLQTLIFNQNGMLDKHEIFVDVRDVPSTLDLRLLTGSIPVFADQKRG